MYSPLNSYAYIHWILDFKYILLLFQMFVVCVVTSDLGLFLVYLFVTEVTNPNDWSVFVCVCGWARI